MKDCDGCHKEGVTSELAPEETSAFSMMMVEITKCDLKETRAIVKRAVTALAKRVDSRVLFLRGEKVILDSDLAGLYRVTVKRLNEQMKRNRARFPSDFLFRLTQSERDCLRSQIATSSLRRGSGRSGGNLSSREATACDSPAR